MNWASWRAVATVKRIPTTMSMSRRHRRHPIRAFHSPHAKNTRWWRRGRASAEPWRQQALTCLLSEYHVPEKKSESQNRRDNLDCSVNSAVACSNLSLHPAGFLSRASTVKGCSLRGFFCAKISILRDVKSGRATKTFLLDLTSRYDAAKL